VLDKAQPETSEPERDHARQIPISNSDAFLARLTEITIQEIRQQLKDRRLSERCLSI
jgi:hypothetical protein